MIKEYIREEEDGARTTTTAIKMGDTLKTHNNKGPAIVNKEQKYSRIVRKGISTKNSAKDFVGDVINNRTLFNCRLFFNYRIKYLN